MENILVNIHSMINLWTIAFKVAVVLVATWWITSRYLKAGK